LAESPTSTAGPKWAARKKSLTSSELAAPRLPQRAQGKARFAQLVDAVEHVLTDRSMSQISLYDIAVEAGVPPASVYHFFPSTAAAFSALGSKFLEAFAALLNAPTDPTGLAGWRDLYPVKAEAIRSFYHSHPAAMKLFLSPDSNVQLRQADRASMHDYAAIVAALYDQFFLMPTVPDFLSKVEIAITLNDSIWALSFHKYGTITEEMARETSRAYDAYLRCYLPDWIPERPLE
jgi:AcrR family transcriptional regulator